jgi:small-conductance mechanosensitive channel
MYKKLLILIHLLIGLSTTVACGQVTPTTVPTESSAPPVLTATPVAGESNQDSSSEEIVITPTPKPTATPGVIDVGVAEISAVMGLDKQVFLGLTGEDWINLGISLLIILVGTYIVTRIVYALLLAITRFTPGERDDEIVAAVKRQINLFISVWIIEFATERLPFIPIDWKETLNQLYFALYIIAVSSIVWKLIDLAFAWHQEASVPEGEVDANESLRLLLKRFLRGLLLIVAITIVLNNLGVNVTIVLAVLVIGALAFSLAAQDVISDMIYGFIILFDQPFRVGDRIEVQDLGTWGDIVEVGARTTRVRTRDNRLVIIPNSTIGENQVINYSYPDPHYRVQTEIDIEYGFDPDMVSQVIVEAVKQVAGVLPDKPVDTLMIELGKSGLKFRVRWWIDTYVDASHVFDGVHRALYDAFNQAGIEMSLSAYDINLKTSDDVSVRSPEELNGKIE